MEPTPFQKVSYDTSPQHSMAVSISQSKKNSMIVKKDNFVMKSQTQFRQNYQFVSQLGAGSFGEVFKVVHKRLRQPRALKVIKKLEKPGFNSYDQLEMLKKLDHPNILKIYQYYESQQKWFIITEFFQGSDLFDQITKSDHISEEKAALILYEILKPLVYIHSQKIAHRDLKAENIMLSTSENGELTVKIIDWGLGALIKTETLARRCGTLQYCAPQVLQARYTESCDMWSLGILVYIMLSGFMPFKGDSSAQTMKLIARARVKFDLPIWDSITSDAKHFVLRLLEKDTSKRMTAQQAIKHPWILSHTQIAHKKERSKTEESLKQTLERIKSFNVENKFHILIINFIHNYLSCPKQQEKLRKEFQLLDENQDGVLSYEQIQKGYQKLYGLIEAEQIVANVFTKLDLDSSGKISYSEFITFASDSTKNYTALQLKQAFRVFDRDSDGLISKRQIYELIRYDSAGDDQLIQGIIDELDFNSDGSIDFEEFIKCLNQSIQQSLHSTERAKETDQDSRPIIKKTSELQITLAAVVEVSNQRKSAGELSNQKTDLVDSPIKYPIKQTETLDIEKPDNSKLRKKSNSKSKSNTKKGSKSKSKRPVKANI